MNSTRTSLLLRIRDPQDQAAWVEFHALYAPLLYAYARARGLGPEDAEDVRATCYEAILRQIGSFEYDRARGGFKAWLRTLVQRRVVDLLRRKRDQQAASHELDELPDRDPPPDELWERSWRQQHLRYCVEKARSAVPEPTYAAFRLLVDEGCGVPEVCSRLDLNPNQVYKAKARVLELVREEMALLDPPEQ